MRTLGCLCALLLACAAHAQYPVKPVHLIVPFPPSGGNDVFARIVAQKLGEAWKQQLIVENRPGAGGSVGTEYAAKAAPDSYTLLLGHTGTLAINPALYPKIGYDTLRDLAPISMLASAPLVLVVNPNSKLHSVRDILDQAKADPEKLTIASSGNGTGSHLTAELLQNTGEITLTPVCDRSTPVAVTSASRIPQLPRVPTVAESGLPDFESTLAYGILAPKGTPKPIIDEIHSQIAVITAARDYKVRVDFEGAVVL